MKIAYQATPQCELMGGNYSGRKRAARKIRLGDVPGVQFLMSMPLVADLRRSAFCLEIRNATGSALYEDLAGHSILLSEDRHRGKCLETK
jgi:hypothetical protein